MSVSGAFRFPVLVSMPLGLVLLATSPASTELLSDPITGFAVDAPQGYAARTMPPTPTFVTRFEIKKPSDRDTGCQVAYTPMNANAGFTQSQLNELIASPRWLDIARATVSLNYDLGPSERFAAGDKQGMAMFGDLKARPGLPERAHEIRTLFIIIETPKGRGTTICVGEKDGFDARRLEFEQIARSLRVP